jgi:hypothetical protein
MKGEEATDEEEEMANEPDYEKIKPKDFGLACLRGKGWNAKESFGKTNKKNVKISDIEVRPRGLYLCVAYN